MISTGGLVQLDDAGAVRESGTQLVSATQEVATRADGLRSGWQGLGAHYSAPEQGLVLAAMDVPDEEAEQLSDKTGQAQTALAAYADRLEELQSRKTALIGDIDAFYADKAATEADNADNHWWDTGWDWATGEDNDLLAREEDLSARAGQLQADKEAAERDCANAIGAIWGAPAYSAADETTVWDENVYGMSADGYEQVALSGDAPWGHPDMWSEGDWTTKTFMLGRGGVRTLTGVVEFAGDAVGFGGAGKAKALWSGVGQLGLDALIVSGPASYLFTSAEQRAESSERLVGVGKGLIGWDTWDTSGWNTAGGLGLDALLTLGSGGTYAAGKGGLKSAMAAGGASRLLAPLRATRAGTLATSMRVTLSSRASTSLNTLRRLPHNRTNRFGSALDNLGPRPAYAGGITPGRRATPDGLPHRMNRNDTPSTGRGGGGIPDKAPDPNTWKWNDETRPFPGETRQEHKDRVAGIDRGDGRDIRGNYTGPDYIAAANEAQGLKEFAQREGVEVIDTQVVARFEGMPQAGRKYDGLYDLGRTDPETGLPAYGGLEIKGPTAPYNGTQKGFDDFIVEGGRAYATVNGRRVVITEIEVYRPRRVSK